jgi:hypothetical protein
MFSLTTEPTKPTVNYMKETESKSSIGTHIDMGGIKRLCFMNGTVRRILNYFSGCKINKKETTVDRLHEVLVAERHHVTRVQLIEALRQLAALNCGEFKTGRKGHPTRMIWSVNIVSLGQVASGHATAVKDIDNSGSPQEDSPSQDESSEHDLLNVSYPLRPELVVSFSLPKSITQKEANRLADFIRTLPFGDEPSQAA